MPIIITAMGLNAAIGFAVWMSYLSLAAKTILTGILIRFGNTDSFESFVPYL